VAANKSALLLITWACAAQAHDVISTKVTWSQEISRIVYSHCAQCHRDRGGAPMALVAYQQVRPWAKAIKEEVHERRMPPWGAMKGFGEFKDDNSLTAEEIHLMGDWVEGGAPEGDPQFLPTVPVAKTGGLPVAGGQIVRDGFRVTSPQLVTAISAPPNLSRGSSLQAVAILPDGAALPLLWLYDFQPKFARAYVYRESVRLPAGTVVRIGGAGKVRLAVRAK
jgi:mono/diheme cytochrome c family protein